MAHVTAGPPLAGAYIALTAKMDDLGAGASDTKTLKLPAGMKAVLVAVTVDSVTSTNLTIEVGSLADADGYAVSQAVPTTPGDLVLAGAQMNAATGRALIGSGGSIVVTVTTAGGGASADVIATAWLYVTSHATNTPGRVSTRDVLRSPLNGF